MASDTKTSDIKTATIDPRVNEVVERIKKIASELKAGVQCCVESNSVTDNVEPYYFISVENGVIMIECMEMCHRTGGYPYSISFRPLKDVSQDILLDMAFED
jgi:hypothetical protein